VASELVPGITSIACIFQGGKDTLQEETLLRIHPFGFLGRDAEEEGIEFIYPLQEASPFAVCCAELVFISVEVQAMVPARGRNFGDTISALA
jgi:hypothetical protein